MKRDVQVGVILGVIILGIIGVFLSTRTPVKEPIIPIPEIEESPGSSLLTKELPEEPPGTLQTQESNVIEGAYENVKEETGKVSENNTKVSPLPEQRGLSDVSSADKQKPVQDLRIHKVQQNESLRKIAEKYYGDPDKWLLIFNENQHKIHDRNNLRLGTELVIPEEKTTSSQVKKEGAASALSQSAKTESTKLTGKKHVVEQGDSLYKLAEKYYKDGSKWSKILDANKRILKDQKSLKVGQELVIPDI